MGNISCTYKKGDTNTKNLNEMFESYICEKLKCLVCMDNIVTRIPSCGHLGVCDDCYFSRSFNKFKNTCIVCKKTHVKYNNIIFPFNINLNEQLNDSIILNKEIIQSCRLEVNDFSRKIKFLDEKENNLKCRIKQIKVELNENALHNKNLQEKSLELQEEVTKLNKFNDELYNDNIALYNDNKALYKDNTEFKLVNKKLKNETKDILNEFSLDQKSDLAITC